jgi:hypothetical protein
MATNKKIVIEYDINGKAIGVAIDQTLNLKRQVVELTKALRSAKEGSDEFKLLSSRLGDAQDQLTKTTAKSKDLFGSLSMLPGPIGEFAGQLQGGIELLKTFSSFTLKDLQFQFKETANDIGDIGKNLSGAQQPTEELSKANTDLAQSAANSTTALNTSAGAAIKNSQAFKEAATAGGMFDRSTGKIVTAQENMTAGMNVNNQAVKNNGAAATAAAVSNGILATSLRAVGASALAASAAVAILDAALAAIGIGLLIAGLVLVGTWLFNTTKALLGFKSETEENIAMTDAFTAALKREAEALALDMEAIDFATKALETRAKIAGKTEEEILEITKQGGRDRLQALRDYDEVLYREQLEVSKNTILLNEQKEKLLTEINNKIIDNGRAINKQIMQNEQTNLDGRLSLQLKFKDKYKEIQGNRLKELDALIKLEIDKEKSGKDQLEKLLKEKLAIRNKLEKLSLAERKVIIAENAKIVNDAIIDDNQRVIQGEIDKYTRLGIKEGVLTNEFFEARKKQAEEQLRFELQEADRDEKTKANKIENARTKYWKALIDIDKEGLDARLALAQTKENAEYEGTVVFFQKQREVEDANYEVQQAAARGNYEKLEALRREHEKKMIAIDVSELNYKAELEQRKATTEQNNYTKVEDRFIESFDIIKKLNERKFDDLRKAEDYSYQAQIKSAGDNAAAKEQIEREHADKLAQIKAQEFEAQKQTTLAIEQVTAQFGQTMAEIGDLMIQEGQGRDKKMFEAGKKAAIAGIAIDKAAAIASIITNTAIANAKSVAAFPLTLGQPWVTINTVSAALSIAATLAAGIKAVSQINSTSFQSSDSGEKSNMLGRNYEDGGMIEGPRHAQGGTIIEAEGGEAIMTRGAVTMFAPLLSAMNQMGGGTSFSKGAVGYANYDNAQTSNPAQEQSPMVIKTYVVSNDMTSEQQKQARLKDLSTL